MPPKLSPLRNLKDSYQSTENILDSYRSKSLRAIDATTAQKLVKDFQNKVLEVLVGVSENAIALHDTKNPDVPSTLTHEKEKFAHEYSSRIAKKITPEHLGFLTVDGLLDRVIRIEAEILSHGSIRIPVRIFSPKTIGRIKSENDGDGREFEDIKMVPKYEALIRVLSKNGIDTSTLIVGVETLEKSQMRTVPYRVIWMADPLRTICISDQMGEKTYVYHGFVDINSLSMHEKGESILGVQSVGVKY